MSRLRASATRRAAHIYERQHEWQQALEAHRELARIKAAPPKRVAAHYLCELATLGDRARARSNRRGICCARRGARPPPCRARRCCVRRSRERGGDAALAARLLRSALDEAPALLQEELPHLLAVVGAERRDAELAAAGLQGAAARLQRAEASGVRGHRGESRRRGAAAPSHGDACSPRTRRSTRVWHRGRGRIRQNVAAARRSSVSGREVPLQPVRIRRDAASTGTARRVSRGTASSPTPSSSCAENPLSSGDVER